MYTTVTKVRQASGFVGNSNVADSIFSGKITKAEGMVNGKVSDAYILPLAKFYTNTITFSGTGSGSGTLTVVINGVSYAVTIASSLTAAQAADRFRTAVLNSAATEVVTDGLGDGAVVNLYSAEGGNHLLVTITSTDPQTVAGITATGGTVTAIAVPMIEYLTTELAAAFILIDEYGPETQDTDKDGFKKKALVLKDLDDIAKKKLKVFDFAGNELASSPTSRLSFSPTAAQSAAGEDGERKFKMNRKF